MTGRLAAAAALAAMIVCPSAMRSQRPARPAERFTAWSRPVFPPAEYATRRALALVRLAEDEVLLVSSAEGTSAGETFRQLDDFEYFAGLEVPQSVLAIDGHTRLAMLFVPPRDPRFENASRPNDFPGRPLASDAALRALSGVDSVLPSTALDAYLDEIAHRHGRVVLDLGPPLQGPHSTPSLVGARSAGETMAAFLQARAMPLPVSNVYAIIAALRMVKSAREIAVMRQAATITVQAIAHGATQVRPGVDERPLTGAFVGECMSRGAQRVAFTPIIKSGANSLWPWRILGAQYDRRTRVMEDGDLVIYDVGCEREHYASDVGRTFPVSGTFTSRQRALVKMVRLVSDAVIAAAKPGVTFGELQRVAQSVIPPSAAPYMQASLYFGHHIGLDAGDPSLADAPLVAGMVFTIEPWYYNHDDGVAVFLEDEILVTMRGSENLTAALARDAEGLERLRRAVAASPTAGDRAVTRDGVLQFTLDRATQSVVVQDLLNGITAATTRVCSDPRSGALSDDDVSFVVRCAGTPTLAYVNTASYAVGPPPPTLFARRRPHPPGLQPSRKNEVIVVGTIHGAHRTSTRYGTKVLHDLLREMRPDFVLTEIAPNRLDAARREFRATGTIVEPRVVRFPEYVDVLFPLTREFGFTIVPTAGWSRPMDAYRTAALKRIEADPARRAEWAEYEAANHREDSLVTVRGADDPYFINSAAYDSIETAAHEPYNRLFNAELGPGGWHNINVSHYGNIARTLDAHVGEGKRFVITYGAGHKEWFMRELKKRTDITILEVAPFLDRIGANGRR